MSTRASGLCGFAALPLIFVSSARPKARVLPDPVCPRPRMSWPAIASGTVAIWIGNGCVMPCAFSALASAGAMPRSRKVVVISVSGVASIRLASARFAEM